MTPRPGLRERKKQATREALRTAALRLALEKGPENVRVDDIAEAAGVSPRTYNNYFASREQAIIAAVTAERESRIAAAVVARPADVGLADAVIDAVVDQYTDPGAHGQDTLLMILSSPALQASYAEAATTLQEPLAEALVRRAEDLDRLTARVLAAAVGVATGLALRQWLGSATVAPGASAAQPPSVRSSAASGLVIPSGSLPDLLRSALTPLAPALDSAGQRR